MWSQMLSVSRRLGTKWHSYCQHLRFARVAETSRRSGARGVADRVEWPGELQPFQNRPVKDDVEPRVISANPGAHVRTAALIVAPIGPVAALRVDVHADDDVVRIGAE